MGVDLATGIGADGDGHVAGQAVFVPGRVAVARPVDGFVTVRAVQGDFVL